MQFIKTILDLCWVLGLLVILGLILAFIVAVIKSAWKLINGYTIKEILPQLNIFAGIISAFRDIPKSDEEKKQNNSIKVFFLLALTGLLYRGILVSPLGSTQIDNVLEKYEYTERYYVNLFPENAESKNYRVEADIYSHLDFDSDFWPQRHYHIRKAYFPDGGSISFENDGDYENLELDKQVPLNDDDMKYWKVELTNARVINQ